MQRQTSNQGQRENIYEDTNGYNPVHLQNEPSSFCVTSEKETLHLKCQPNGSMTNNTDGMKHGVVRLDADNHLTPEPALDECSGSQTDGKRLIQTGGICGFPQEIIDAAYAYRKTVVGSISCSPRYFHTNLSQVVYIYSSTTLQDISFKQLGSLIFRFLIIWNYSCHCNSFSMSQWGQMMM